MTEALSSSIGIPPIEERGIYSIENFSASCKKLSELPDGVLFLRIASKNGVIYYEFLNKIKKDHYIIPWKDIYDQKTRASYSPPWIERISGYIFALFQEEEKKWLMEDVEWNSRRYVFTMRVKDSKLERITREKCIKRVQKSQNTQISNNKRIQRIMWKAIQKASTMR